MEREYRKAKYLKRGGKSRIGVMNGMEKEGGGKEVERLS